MHFINKLIKKGTFSAIFAFLFFAFFNVTNVSAADCQIQLNDGNEFLVLNTKSGWTDSGVNITCDGTVKKDVSVTINGGTPVLSSNSGANLINSYVKTAGFYQIKYYLTADENVSLTRQIRVLPNDLNSSINTWVANTDALNTTNNDTFSKILKVSDGYILAGNFGNNAYITKYNLIGKMMWTNHFDCLSNDWFFNGIDGYSSGTVTAISITDMIATNGTTSLTDFYISGTYTMSGETKAFVRRIQLSSGESGGLVNFGKIVTFEMTKINKILMTGNYIVAVGYSVNGEGVTIGKIARSTINSTDLVGIVYYSNTLESSYNSFITVSENNVAKIVAVGNSAVGNVGGAVGGYITTCSVEGFSVDACTSEQPYYYLTYNQSSATETYFNDIVSRENGYLVVGKSRIDRVRGKTDSYNNTNTENVIFVSLNANLGIADVQIKDNSYADNLNAVKEIEDNKFLAVGKKGNTGYYAEITIDENGDMDVAEKALSGTNEITDVYVRTNESKENNYVFVGNASGLRINDVGVANKGQADAYMVIIDNTSFDNFDNISVLQNQNVCEQESDPLECSGDLVLDEYKLKYGNKLIAYPTSASISSKTVGDITTYHTFTSFDSLVNFVIGRVIVVIENSLPDNVEISQIGIDKWYLYNRNESTALRDDVWSEYYYPVENNQEKKPGVTYYVFEFNTSTSSGHFKVDTRTITYTNANFLKFEIEPHANNVAFQGEEKAKEYALLQEYGRIKLVNKKYDYQDGVDALDNTSLFAYQGYYFVYYIDLTLGGEKDELCNIDINGKIKGICTNQNGYAFVNLKNIQTVLNQILEKNNYFISEKNTRYTTTAASKPTSDIYKEETTTMLYTKEMTFNLKENAYLVVEFYKTLLGENGYYFATSPAISEVHGKNSVAFKKSSGADYTGEGKYIVKYCYNYGESNEVCGNSGTFVIDRTVPTINYKTAGSSNSQNIDYDSLYRGKSENNPYLMTKDITVSSIFDADPYSYTIANNQKYYLKCNADINDAKCLNNLEEYVNIAYEYDKENPNKVFSITAMDRAGNEMTFYFKIGTQMMEISVNASDDDGNSFNLSVDLYERNDFASLAVQYTKSENCEEEKCTKVDAYKIADFGNALATYIKAVLYFNRLELSKAQEDPEYVIDESKITKSVTFLVSLSSTLDNQIVGGISIPKVNYNSETKEYEILTEMDTFTISKGLYNFTLIDSFYNESKAIGGIGIDKAELNIYENDDSGYNETKNNFTCSGGEGCDKRLPSTDEDELTQTTIFFKGKTPETYTYKDLIPTTLYNDFNRNMLFTNKFVYIKFKINNFGIVKINVANTLNVMNNYTEENLTCLFVFYGEQVSAPACGSGTTNQYKFSDFQDTTSDVKNKLEEKGIYFLTQMGTTGEEYCYLVFTNDGTYNVSSELYTDITGVEGAEGGLVTLPVTTSFVIDSKKPSLVASVRCDTVNCKGEQNNFNTSDFIYDKNDTSSKIINIGSYSVEFDLEADKIKDGVINRLLVMTVDGETYYNPYTCALGRCDESVNALNLEFTSDGKFIRVSKSGTYILTFVDAGGNEITYAFVIDKEAPVVGEIVDINNKNLNEYQQYVDVKVTISENSFLENKLNEIIMNINFKVTSENESSAIPFNSITVINDNGECKIGVGSGYTLENQCSISGNTSKSLTFSFSISINKDTRETGTNTLTMVITDYFNNSSSKSKDFIFDNESPYIEYDGYVPTTKFGEDEFDDNKDNMLSMSANSSLEEFECETGAIVAEKGKIKCKDLPNKQNIKNNVVVKAYEAYRVTYNNYAKEQNGTYTLRENNVYADANVTLYKKIHTRYSNETTLNADKTSGKNIYTRGAYIQVRIGEQIDPNQTYYYGDSKTQVSLTQMYRTDNPVCTTSDLECTLYTMYNDNGKFADNSYYTLDSNGFTKVEDNTTINTSNYLNYYSDVVTYIEDDGKYIMASTLPNSCMKINDGSCTDVAEGRIKLINDNVKYYNKAASAYSITSNLLLDQRIWQIALSNGQEVNFGFGLVSRFGRPIIFRATDGAGNNSINYLETVIIIEDREAPSVIDIGSVTYRVDTRGLTKTDNNYIKQTSYYKVSEELRNNRCEENKYYKLNASTYEIVACDEMNDTTQYYVKVEEYVEARNNETKTEGVVYYVRDYDSLKTSDGKYNLTNKDVSIKFSEPIYKLVCTYYSSLTGEEKDCSVDATEFDYRENKISFDFIVGTEGDYYINYTLTVYDFFNNQTTINYLFIDRQKPTINFYDNLRSEDRRETNYTSNEPKYDTSYINTGYKNEIKSTDSIEDRIKDQNAEIYIHNSFNYNVTYYKYNFDLTYNNYIKNADNTFTKVADGETKDSSKKYYTLMKKVDGFIFRGGECISLAANSNYCYAEDYYNYYPELLSNPTYWTALVKDEYGDVFIKEDQVGVYKIEYKVSDIAENTSDTLIKTVYVVDTKTPQFKINGSIVDNLSGYYNKVQILFENEQEGIYQVYYCTDTPTSCVLPSNIFDKATGKLKTESKNVSDIGGEYNYSSQAQGTYKFYVYDKGNYNENKTCTNDSDCANNETNVMYLKYNYSSHQFVIDTEKPILKIDAQVDEQTNKLFYMLSLEEDAKLYCKQGNLRGTISPEATYINCEEILNGTYTMKPTNSGYTYTKTNSNGDVVYEIKYTKVSPTADKYFFVTYYKENVSGGFSEYPMGYEFTAADANNVYRIDLIIAYIREDGAYEIIAEDKATNQTGRFYDSNYEGVSRIDVDNTAPSYNKSQTAPTGSSYWYSVPKEVVNSNNSNLITTLLNSMSNSTNSLNINENTALNNNMFYAFATQAEALNYLYGIYGNHVNNQSYTCEGTKLCYSYYDIEQKTFVIISASTQLEIVNRVTSSLSKLVFATYGGDKLFGDENIHQLVCTSKDSQYCGETNMYKSVYLVTETTITAPTYTNVYIDETCPISSTSIIECIKINAKIINYSYDLSIDIEVGDANTIDTKYVKYYYKYMNSTDSTHSATKEATFTLPLSGGTYYVFEEVDEDITYTNSSNKNHVNHNNKSYYAIFVDDNSYLTINSQYKKGETTSAYEEISINSNGSSNIIKTNADEYYLIIKQDASINRFNQHYEIFEYVGINKTEIYSYLRLSRVVKTQFTTSSKVYENINDYLYTEGSTYYFKIPVGVALDDNMIVTIELTDRAGNVTTIIVSKSQQAPSIQLTYLGEDKNEYAQVSITNTWNTSTLTSSDGMKVLWSKDGNTYESNNDILNSLKCVQGTQRLKYGCINVGAVNGINSYNVKISNIDYTYGFFKIYLKDDHGNTREIEFIYNPLDFSITYSTSDSEIIKYIDNNTFMEEEERMISKGNLVLSWNDIVNYLNLYKLDENNIWQKVCSSENMITGHAGKCSTTGSNDNKIEANFESGKYVNSKLTYTDEGIYKVELVNRQSILINNKCIQGSNVYCKEIYTDVSNIFPWEINEEECIKALEIKKLETSTYNSNREYRLFEIDKTIPTTEGVTITIHKPSGNVVFDTIEEFIRDIRSYTNSEVTIEWNEKLVVLKWTCKYNISYVIQEIGGSLFVTWLDNGSISTAAIVSNSFTIGQTFYTITENPAGQSIVTWNNGGTVNSVPITQNSDGNKTFRMTSSCNGGTTQFNEASLKKFGIDSRNDVIYNFMLEDFAGNINENNEYSFTINIKLPEIEIYEVDENGNKLVDAFGNELLIEDGSKVKNNVKLFCYEDSIITDCTSAYIVELQVLTANGYVKQDTNIMVKETYGRTSQYKFSAYVKKDGNDNYYPNLYAELEFTIDKQPPKIIINGASMGVYNYYKGEVAISIDDALNGIGYIYKGCVLEDEQYVCEEEPFVTFSSSAYTLTKTGTYLIKAIDEIGNITQGSDIKYITIDNDNPDIMVTADTTYVQYELPENSYTNAKVINVSSVDNNPGSYLKYRINEGEWITLESSTMQFTEEGIYEIKAFDSVNNESVERHFIIYRQLPKYQLFVKDVLSKSNDIIKDDAYLTWKEPQTKAEAPIVKVTLNGENYAKKQKITETGEYTFVLTDLAGNTATYKIIINKSDRICLNNFALVPKKQYLLPVNDFKILISGSEDYKYKADDTFIFATRTSIYKGNSQCGSGILGYKSLDDEAYLVLTGSEADYINTHVETTITLEEKYQEILAKSDGYVYVFVVDKKVAKRDLGMSIGENVFSKDPLGWALIFIAGAAIIYGASKVFIFRKKVKVLK